MPCVSEWKARYSLTLWGQWESSPEKTFWRISLKSVQFYAFYYAEFIFMFVCKFLVSRNGIRVSSDGIIVCTACTSVVKLWYTPRAIKRVPKYIFPQLWRFLSIFCYNFYTSGNRNECFTVYLLNGLMGWVIKCVASSVVKFCFKELLLRIKYADFWR